MDEPTLDDLFREHTLTWKHVVVLRRPESELGWWRRLLMYWKPWHPVVSTDGYIWVFKMWGDHIYYLHKTGWQSVSDKEYRESVGLD